MAYHSEDVQIVLPSRGGIDIGLWRRNRKQFRNRLLALGGQEGYRGGILGIPVGRLEEVKQVIAEEYPDWRVKIRDERPVQKRPGDRVWWANESGYHGSSEHNGYVGRVRLFSVRRDYRDNRFHLRTELPGFEQSQHEGVRRTETRDEAERFAEEVLMDFLDRIGVQFKN